MQRKRSYRQPPGKGGSSKDIARSPAREEHAKGRVHFVCREKARVRLVGTCAVRRLWRHGVFVARCTMECNRVVLLLPAAHSRRLRVSTAGPSCTSSASRWCAARLRKALGDSLVGRHRSAAQESSRACCARLARRFVCRHYAPAAYGLQLALCVRLQLEFAAGRLERQFFMFWATAVLLARARTSWAHVFHHT